MATEVRKYRPSPTLEQFHASDALVRGVVGPIGSGKSVAMCTEIYFRALEQTPDTKRRRRSRWVAIRNTYPELKTTTIKTWHEWMPMSRTVMTHPPVWHYVNRDIGDGTSLDLEVFFLSLEHPDDVSKLKSFELTGGWINEASELPTKDILDMLVGRIGRFPPKVDFGLTDDPDAPPPYWSGVIMDTNAPDTDHWWYRLLEEERPHGYEVYHQPPAVEFHEATKSWVLNPQAENVRHQPKGPAYYLDQVKAKDKDWIDVFLRGEYGSTRAGKPVYPEYQDDVHCAKEPLKPLAGVDVILGWDFGLTPSCVQVQVTPRGQLLVLGEISAEDMGIRQFSRDAVRPFLSSRFPAGTVFRSYGDPAGNQRAQTDEQTCMEELRASGIPTEGARTNGFTARREAVAGFLTRQGGFLLDQGCMRLRKGFISGYHYKRHNVIGSDGREVFAVQPDKNIYSHVHDALQYAALEAEGGAPSVKTTTKAQAVVPVSARGWS